MGEPQASTSIYRIGNLLAEGGYGKVYLAEWHQGEHMYEVAAKLLSNSAGDPHAHARHVEEARLLMWLDHAHIPRLIDLTVIAGKTAVVLEYVQGVDLSKIRQRLPPRATLDVARQVASALAHALDSDVEVVHRDVTPRNIRLRTDGRAMLLDFGIAKALIGDRPVKTQEGMAIGSLDYFSKERFALEGEQRLWDVYGLGATLLELASRHRLVKRGERGEKIFLLHASGKMRQRIEDALADIEYRPLRELVAAMVAERQEDRPSSHEVATRATRLAAEAPGQSLSEFATVYLHRLPTPGRPDELFGREFVPDRSTFTLERPLLASRTESYPSVMSTPVRTGLIAAGGLAFASAVSIGVVAASTAVFALAIWMSTETLGSPPVEPEPEPNVTDTAPPGTGDGSSGTPSGNPVATPPPPPMADDFYGCGERMAIEAAAAVGELATPTVSCLRTRVQDGTLSQTDRQKVGYVLVNQWWTQCRDHRECEEFDWLMPYYFEELSQHDSELTWLWSIHLNAKGTVESHQEAIHWAGVALYERQRLPKDRYVSVVLGAHEVRTRSAQAIWTRYNTSQGGSGSAEDWRIRARNYSVEWGTALEGFERDTAPARNICAVMQGDQAWCEQNIGEGSGSMEITFLSIPSGAALSIDGIAAGETRKEPYELSFGLHRIEIDTGKKRFEVELMVTSGSPSGYQWDSREGDKGWKQL